MKRYINKNIIILFIIVVIYMLYSALYIYQTSFLIDGIKYFALFDDEMISMRFARNIANGFGPVWNIAENPPVEGYSNPLWMLIMTIPHLCKIPINLTSLFIQILAVILMIINLIQNYLISQKLFHNIIITVLSLLFNIFYLPILAWTLLGTEVTLLIVLNNWIIQLFLKNHEKKRHSLNIFIPATIALFVRMDASVVFLGLILFLSIYDKKYWKKYLITGLIILLLSNILIISVRYSIYGEIFPNTYYLKMTGFPILLRVIKGILISLRFIFYFNFIIFFLAFYFAINQKSRIYLLIPILLLSQMLYSSYVGGDAWEWWGGSNRYISVMIPLFFIYVANAIFQLNIILNNFLKKFQYYHKSYYNLILMFIFTISIVNVNCLNGAYTFEELYFNKKPFTVNFNKKQLETAQTILKFSNNKTSIAVISAGVIPYFTNLKTYDMLGKNDKYISKLRAYNVQVGSKFTKFNPGHNKWDYSYSIGKLKPDIIVNLWYKPEDAIPYLEKYYYIKKYKDYYLIILKDSKNLEVEKIKNLSDASITELIKQTNKNNLVNKSKLTVE